MLLKHALLYSTSVKNIDTFLYKKGKRHSAFRKNNSAPHLRSGQVFTWKKSIQPLGHKPKINSLTDCCGELEFLNVLIS